jgi:hypothetical protein
MARLRVSEPTDPRSGFPPVVRPRARTVAASSVWPPRGLPALADFPAGQRMPTLGVSSLDFRGGFAPAAAFQGT